MSLESYKRKRDFSKTPEPEGSGSDHGELSDSTSSSAAAENQWRFVVQKHDATRLHYDLRLELDGVLLSWAVPKGPSLDWTQKRLSIHVEDHPIDYLEFEGVIPKHEYGGGTVMVWDIGTWTPRHDARKDYESGALKFDLAGEKLQGGYMLKRLDSRGDNQWLLIKEKDSAMRETADFDVLRELPDSVLTNRTLDEITADRSAIWTGREKLQPIEFDPAPYPKAKKSSLPELIRPCLPTATRNPPTGDMWIHEIKHDGYRMLCFLEKGNVRFQSRNGKDWTGKLPSLSRMLANLPCETAILDGEIVRVDENGLTSFQALQNRIGAGKDAELRYYAFDILHFNGHQLTACPLIERKQVLAELAEATSSTARFLICEYLEIDGPTIFQHACKLGMEGIVSKRKDKRYSEGRFEYWLKTKCLQSREFVIGGFTPPTASRQGLGAIVLGTPTEDGRLHFLGKVGTGFSHTSLVEIRRVLDGLVVSRSPFGNLDKRSADKGTIWVEPRLIAEIEFGGWTEDELIRFGAFRGLRDDLQIEDLEIYGGPAPVEPPTDTSLQSDTAPASDVSVDARLPIPDALSEVRISNPKRVVYPDMGITKLGLATYYAQIGNAMLPHIAGRPISLFRCPGGLGQTCFFQKRAPQGISRSVERVELPTTEGKRAFLVIHDLVGLLSLIQFSAMELHVTNSKADSYEEPDLMVFDLDPDPNLPWADIKNAAKAVRARVEEAGYACWLKTTGGKGLHIVTPVESLSWDDTKQISKELSAEIAKESPKKFTTNVSKRARKGRVYLDVNRNTRGASTVAVYSSRAKPRASVSVPTSWDELDEVVGSDAFNLQATMSRVAESGDVWAKMWR